MSIKNQNIRKLLHTAKIGLEIVIRNFILKFAPKKFNSLVAKMGYSSYTPFSAFEYHGKVYGGPYRIIANGRFPVERNATRKTFVDDPAAGIYALNIKDWVMLDVGANVGAYSILGMQAGARLVYSVEPGPFYDRLLLNIKLNGLEDVIKPFRIGFSAKAGKLLWSEDENNPGNAHLVSSVNALDLSNLSTRLSDSPIEVDVVRLDDFVESENISRINLIKIDVEGMEWEVLSSGKRVIERDFPIIVAETHRAASDMMRYDCTTPMFVYLYSIGYLSFKFVENKFVKFIYPNFSLDTFFIHGSMVKNGRFMTEEQER